MSVELDERLLDDPDALAAADLAGMLRTIAGSGAQVREASTLVGEADVESLADERPRAVVLVGRRVECGRVRGVAGAGCRRRLAAADRGVRSDAAALGGAARPGDCGVAIGHRAADPRRGDRSRSARLPRRHDRGASLAARRPR